MIGEATTCSTPAGARATLARRIGPVLLMAASGFAGLGYQIVWSQQSALWLGHDAAAVLAVVTAFFAGLALGSLFLGVRIETSATPVRWYAACELLIGTWALLLTSLMRPFSSWVLQLLGPQPAPLAQWCAAFVSTFVLLLPATAAMGATLPAMARIAARWRREGRSVGGLYASNTAGAMAGVLAMGFWLAPQFGLNRTVMISAGLNLLCAAGALLLFAEEQEPAPAVRVPGAAGARFLLTRLAVTGLLGIGYEVLVVRVLSEVAEDTVYTFALLLAAYLLGSAVGAAVQQRHLRGRGDPHTVTDRLLCALSMSCLAGTAGLWAAEALRSTAIAWMGGGLPAALAAEGLLAVSAFALPAALMGALFSHLSDCAVEQRVGLGRALAANTAGAAGAPILFGVIFLPAIGAKLSLAAVAAGYSSLAAWRRRNALLVVIPLAAAASLALWAPPLVFIEVPAGGRVVSYREGAMAAVSVVEDAAGVRRLRINNRQQEGSSSSLRVDGRQALLPLLMHPAPRDVLFLGLGTGVTSSTAAMDPELRVDAVELLPEVIEASAHFRAYQDEAGRRPNLHIITADARRYVRTSAKQYDVIIADNFHPARSGSGSLYTIEHFAAMKSRLAPAGVFCQWLPLHQLDLQTLRSIVQSFLQVYPDATALLASNSLQTPVLGLLAHEGSAHADPTSVRSRLATATATRDLAGFGLEDEYAVLGTFVAGPGSLRRFAAGAAANTDDHPVVAYRAPHITYAPDSTPADRLTDLLAHVTIEPSELIPVVAHAAEAARLQAYWSARNQFIEAGTRVHPSADVIEMLTQVREPLLSVLRVSPDFRPAYDPLLMMATQLSHTDPRAAHDLLAELIELQPSRSEARLALQALNRDAATAPQ